MRIHRFTIALIVVALASACSKEEPKPPAATPAATTATPPPAQPAPAAPAPAPAPTSSQAVFGVAELDQMVAPIALYPDSLLAQVLMAATYPGNVADAVAWSKANPDAKGDDAVRQVAAQPWDPSVQSLVAFPQVMARWVWIRRGCSAWAMRSWRSPRTSWTPCSACAGRHRPPATCRATSTSA